MSSGALLGILAIVTLGIVVVYGLYHFRTFLQDPKNKGHAKNALVDDEKGATAHAREGDGNPAAAGSTLKERLDSSPSSSHPTTETRSKDRV